MFQKKLGYDRVFGLGIVWLAVETGFAAATTNPFTVNIAQGIAEIPLNSGITFRLVFFAFAFSIAVIFLLRYGAKIKKDPSKSVMPDDDFSLEEATHHNGGKLPFWKRLWNGILSLKVTNISMIISNFKLLLKSNIFTLILLILLSHQDYIFHTFS